MVKESPEVGRLQIEVKALKAEIQDLKDEKARREYSAACLEVTSLERKVEVNRAELVRALWKSDRRDLSYALISITRALKDAENRVRELAKALPAPSEAMGCISLGGIPAGLMGPLFQWQKRG